MPDDSQPAIHVAGLRKTFNVPVREAGLRASLLVFALAAIALFWNCAGQLTLKCEAMSPDDRS